MWSPSFRRSGRASWRLRSRTRSRAGVLGPRTAAVTFAVLKVLALHPSGLGVLSRRRSATRGLAFATLGGTTLRLLGFRMAKHLRRGKWVARPWGLRARRAIQEPVEAALAVVMLGALALPLLVEPGPGTRPGQAPPLRHDARSPGGSEHSAEDDGDDRDDLGLEGPIASW